VRFAAAVRMRWSHVQALHWRVPKRSLPRLPKPLEVDTSDGHAWVSLVALRVQGTRLGRLPLGSQDYAQVNLRTYVRHAATRGIWLLKTYARDREACLGARLLGLPYEHAPVRVERGSATVPAGLHATWGLPEGLADGDLDRFLLERHHLFAQAGRLTLRVDVRHPPWEPQASAGSAQLTDRRLAHVLPRAVRGKAPDLAHVAPAMDVEFLRPWRL